MAMHFDLSSLHSGCFPDMNAAVQICRYRKFDLNGIKVSLFHEEYSHTHHFEYSAGGVKKKQQQQQQKLILVCMFSVS